MGRSARGVKGIDVDQGDGVITINIVNPTDPREVLTVTKGGYGKRTKLEEYRKQTRNGRGLLDIDTGSRNGPVVGVEMVNAEDSYVAITKTGRTIYTATEEISVQSRNTMGVNIMELEDDDSLAELAVFSP